MSTRDRSRTVMMSGLGQGRFRTQLLGAAAVGGRYSDAGLLDGEELSRREDADLADAPQGEQVLVAGHDDIGLARLGGLDEAVVVGVAGDRDRLGGGDHDGRQRKQIDDLVCVADGCLQLG
jgi:hypothetical protein